MPQLLAHKETSPLFKIILLLISLFLGSLSICYAQEKSPVDVVKLFNECYGDPRMDEIVDYTTTNFRDNKPKSVWVVDTWRALQEIEYKKLDGKIIDSKVKGDKAVVIVQDRITTVAGEASHKEIYHLTKSGEKWLIDNLVVTDEEVDL